MPDGSKGFRAATSNGGPEPKQGANFMQISRPKLNYANVIATIALFVALGGAAVAAGLPKKSVGSQQLKPGAVTTKALRKKAVTSGKLAPKAVTAGKLGANAVLPGNLGNGVIGTEKLADGAVLASKIKNGAVTTNKLNNGAVTTGKLGDGAVTSGKLADSAVTPSKLSPGTMSQLRGKLESGETVRGVFDIGATGEADDVIREAITFQAPLAGPPTPIILKVGQTSSACPGLGSNAETPQAAGGYLCIYVTSEANLNATTPLAVENNNRLGFGLYAKSQAVGAYNALGQWAVTAP
jgi:hypothetical protein